MKTTFTISHDILAIGVFPRKYQPEIRRIFDASDKKGGFVTLTIETVRKPRTTGEGSQNRAINGFIQQIANYTGEDFDRIKTYCKLKAVSRGYPFQTDNEGNILYSKITREPLLKSEADISTEEAGYLIDTILEIAADIPLTLIEK